MCFRLLSLAFAAFAFALPLWQDELPRGFMRLAKIKLRMQENLARIPNYTCLETITRGRRGPDRLVIAVPGKEVPFRRMDVLRLEVAQVDGTDFSPTPASTTSRRRSLANSPTAV